MLAFAPDRWYINIIMPEVYEEKIERLNRLYSVLSRTNQAIIRAVDRDSLFRDICHIAVEQGGFLLAWIGLVDEDSGMLAPSVWRGKNDGYLDNIRISILEEPEGLGPSGRAVREGDVCIAADFAGDPSMAPWRESALERGFRSSAAISFRQGSRVIGVLTLYSGQKDFFDQAFAELLREMGRDISYALDGLHKEAERARTQHALHAESMERLRLSEELREKENALVLKSRQAAVGETVEYIAHQWKQPLNALSIYAQLIRNACQKGVASGEYAEKLTGKILEQVDSMSRTIDDFRNFARPETEARAFSLKQAVDASLALVEDSLKACTVRVEAEDCGDLEVRGYGNEYSQVVLNILNNAKDAFVERKVDSPTIDIRLFRDGNKAVATIADNAGGIPEDAIDRIFSPYFTTKASDGGSGIGLYLSRTIIENRMKGRLSVRNVGEGAEFRIEV